MFNLKHFTLLFTFLVLTCACAVKQATPSFDNGPGTPVGFTWQLIELQGKEITATEGRPNATITFEKENGKVNGNSGCNSFFGTYTITEGHRITITGLGSTMMACADVPYEQEFLSALQAADNFTLTGDTLSLNKARLAPLARLVRKDKS
jgi:heat shock protein HslJ